MNQRNHILVVEDEHHLATGIKYNLEAEGYRATIVGDGNKALRLFEDPGNTVDLVILDLMLPGMSGYSVCDALRGAGNDVPILMLSARTLAEDRSRGFDVGANQYLTKPFELDELLSRVKNLLTFASGKDQTSAAEAEIRVFRFANVETNFETHQVTVDGKPIRLTSLEMKLLRYFCAHPGRVIPRTELLENVWSMPGSVTTRAPDQFIRRLRKYFEPDAANPSHFLTIRDVGYRFVPENESQEGGASGQPTDTERT